MLATALIAATILTNAADVSEAVFNDRADVEFDIVGVVTLPNKPGSWHMAVEDDSGGILLRNHSPTCDTQFFKPGERLRLCGKTAVNHVGIVFAQCTQVVAQAVGPAPVPRPASIDELLSGTLDNRLVQITGAVREVFRDEVDSRWLYMVLNGEGSRIAVAFIYEPEDISRFTALVDATVTVTGLCTPIMHGIRRLLGRHVSCLGPDAIRVVAPAPADPFAVPAIDNETRVSPREVDRMGRRRMTGRVLAVWSDRQFLFADASGGCHRAELVGDGPPAYGELVEVTGFPATDLYRIHLSGGLWRPATNETAAAQTPGDSSVLTSADFHRSKFGRLNRFVTFNGRTARFRGTVESIELGAVKYRTCAIRCEDFTVNVNSGTAGGFPEGLAIGSQVEVTGTWVIATGIWHPSVTFPHIEGVPMVVLRRAGDLKIVAAPPWWTPLRLVVVIGVLVLLLAAILLWALTLKIVAERRGRLLFRAEIGKAEETLRVAERSRLAVELHDTIAQNLTGAAFQIEAAQDATEPTSEAASYLDCAKQILKSCRTELRRCIWDLRSNTLDEPDMNKAILATVQPVANGADVHVRFNVPRSRLSDTTAHAILRIIRELTANAVRHGHASRVRIAGDFTDGQLHFSVGDNGCGFNPDSCPGPSTGHFGLAGIRERIDTYDGTMEVASRTDGGTRVEISIRAPHAQTTKGG